MNKRISLSSFIVITHVLSLCAMEIDEKQKLSHQAPSQYGALTETIAHDIEQQQQLLKYAPFSSSSLQEMSTHFHDMSPVDKYNTIQHMPTHIYASKILSFLYGIVMLLPPEIIENHICLFMMEGRNKPDLTEEQVKEQQTAVRDAANKFYTLPFLHAFDVYHEIKMAKVDDTKPIGALYLSYLKERDLIRELQNISSLVTRSAYDEKISLLKEKTNTLDDDLKKAFLPDKKIFVLPGKDLWRDLLMSSVLTLSTGGVCFGLPTGILSISSGCAPALLGLGIGGPFGFCFFANCGFLCMHTSYCDQPNRRIEKITIG